MIKVLLAEDDLKLGKLINYMLMQNRVQVEWIQNGADIFEYAMYSEYDILILDWMMPNVTGIEACRQLRENGYERAILMLTAKDTLEDRVTGLDAGADDYLVKPFEFDELLARLRALSRRSTQKIQQEIVEVGKIADEYGGGRVFQIDSSVQEPNDFNKITGLKLNVTLNKMGSFSGAMPTSMMIITKGAHQGSEYIFTYPDSFPVYDLANKELVVLGVGPSAFICPMAFKYGKALEETFAEGETRTLTFEGNRALFSNDSSVMTIIYFTGDFSLNSVEWIKDKIIPEPDISWEKVEKKVFSDIETVDHEKQNGNNYIDITVPANREGPFQVIFWIHGGGWQSMSRKSCILDDTKEYLLYCGYAFVSAEYTLVNHTDGRAISPKLGMIHDLKAAVRFIRANAKKYNLNTNYIVAMGESAGGHLSFLMGTTNGNAKHEDLSMGNANYSSDVHAAIGYFAPSTFLVTNTSSTEDTTMSYALLGNEVLEFNNEIM